MDSTAGIFTLGACIGIIIGAAVSVLFDRLWRKAETIPLFSVSLGAFRDRKGDGLVITTENVGLEPIPEYTIALSHPGRPSLMVFTPDPTQYVVPQHPHQWNKFQCLTKPNEPTPSFTDPVKNWFLCVNGKEVDAPYFSDFRLRIVLKNSDHFLLDDEGLGNTIAREMYHNLTEQKLEQEID